MAEELEPTPSDGPGLAPEPEAAESVPGEAAPDPVEEPTEVEVEPEATPESEPEVKPAAEVVEPEPEPAKPAKVVRQAVVEPDALDKEFEDAISAINGDEMLSEGQKAKERLELKTKWEERTERRQAKAQAAQDSIWQRESESTGVAAEQCEKAWDDVVKSLEKSGRAYSRDYATGLYHAKLEGMKPAGRTKPNQNPPKTPTKAPAKGAVLPRGASGRVAPVVEDNRTVMEKLGSGDPKLLKEFKEITEAFQNDDV